MGDRIAVMRDGILQQVGAPQTLYETPQNLFVAAFIGSPAMNFATVKIQDGGLALSGKRLELGGGGLAGAVARREDGSDLVLGFRPEHMSLAGGTNSAVRIPAKVDVVEYLGHEELVHAQVDGHEIVALSAPHPSLRAGATVEFAVPVEHLHLFDPVTEERLVPNG